MPVGQLIIKGVFWDNFRLLFVDLPYLFIANVVTMALVAKPITDIFSIFCAPAGRLKTGMRGVRWLALEEHPRQATKKPLIGIYVIY